MTERMEELRANLAAVRQRISDACGRADRPDDSVALLPVTKTFPASDLDLLAELGCADVGESRDQEARAKREQCAWPLRWHMIGQVQRRKARQICEWADVVESVDRIEVADSLSTGASAANRVVDVLLQVSLDQFSELEKPAGRGGVTPAQLLPLAGHVLALPGLHLAGVMAVAPLNAPAYQAFAALRASHLELLSLAPSASVVSAGMSGDFEAAIAAGATQVRIGGALLGNRQALK